MGWDDWRTTRMTDVAPDEPGHTIHAYFNAAPESVDGRWLLYARSQQADAQRVDVCLRSRADGSLRVLEAGVDCEDAHRVACQHWAGDGQVVWHRLRGGRFEVRAADAATGETRQLAADRLLGWGYPGLDTVPLYGAHWDAAAPRDLLLADLRTGECRVALTVARLREFAATWLDATFGAGAPVSIFFPILSPDGRRVMFKVACPRGGEMRSSQASHRTGLFVWDLAADRLLWQIESWGHPAWSPDSQAIVNVQNLLVDAADGATRQLDGVPAWPGSHPAWHPDGDLYVTDTQLERFGSPAGWWGVALVRRDGGGYRILQRFNQNGGASSWRIPHPHPIFSADGQRIYVNVNRGPHTRLHVIEPA